ncbi:MAG: hypothetical protein ABIE94_01585 [archaeon]
MKYEELSFIYLHNTDLAVLVTETEDEEGPDVWIPLSVINEGNEIDFNDYDRGDLIELEVAVWFALREGLI